MQEMSVYSSLIEEMGFLALLLGEVERMAAILE